MDIKSSKKRACLLILVMTMLVSAISVYGGFVGNLNVNAGKYEDYFMRVVTAEPVIYAEPGDTVNFRMYVRRGDDPFVLHNVQIIDNNDDFSLFVYPQNIPQIRNKDMIPLRAELIVPEGTPEGLYQLKIKVKGDEFVEEPYPIQTLVRVGRHTDYASISFLVLSAAIIGFLIWRKVNIKKL